MSVHRVGPEAADASNAERHPAVSPRVPRRAWLRRLITLFGVASLAYLLGAAVIFFDLPSSPFLRAAFVGGAAWCGQQQARAPLAARHAAGTQPVFTIGSIDQPDRTCDGFTLCMCSDGTRAVLINMRGEVVHEWRAPVRKVWPNAPHLLAPGKEAEVYFNDGHLYPNGDLLAVVEGPTDARSRRAATGW